MRITQADNQVLCVPLKRPIHAPPAGNRGKRIDHIYLLVVHLDTDAGHRGLGVAYAIEGGGRALQAIAQDDLSPLLIGEDPLDHERLAVKVLGQLAGIAQGGLVLQAYSAIDLALWDVKGKVAGLPLWKLLGGARETAPVYGADAGWLWMTPEEIVEASRAYLDQGMMGIKVRVGGTSPEVDAERVTRVREALGEDAWLAVDASQRYDYATALSMGHFFEEEMGIDWFEEPLICKDIEGHARLADKLEVPITAGGALDRHDLHNYLAAGAADILQANVTCLGGLTQWLKIAAVAEAYHRPMAAHLLPEVGVHLACALPTVRAVEYVPWLNAVFAEPMTFVNGQLVPPKRPGLGLEIRPDAIEKYRLSA
jgi:L-alanine-DL-glutamate epimerase-like enolase superfamily enzyme